MPVKIVAILLTFGIIEKQICPTCSWKDTLKWGERMQNSLLAIPHRHVVMTLPHSLNSLVMTIKKELTNA